MQRSDRKKILTLSFTLVVVMLGYGLVIPVMPFYIDALGASGSELGLLVALSAFMELIFAPLWGSLSDRIGRRPLLLLGMLGGGLSMLFFGLATELWMLFLARALTGVLSSATMPTALAYIGDTTSEKDRGGGMGTLGAAMGLGVIIGPGIGGWLARDSLSLPFFFAAGLSLLTVLLIYFMLPESLPPANRKRGRLKTFQARLLWQALFSPIGVLLFLAFLVSFSLTNFETVFGLFALEKFSYGPEEVGTILMVIGLVTTFGKGLFTGPLTRRFGDALVIKASCLAGSVGFLVLLLAQSYIGLLLATGFFVLSKTFLRPAVLSLTSKRTDMGQGAVMGLSNSFMSLGRTIGPIFAGFIFDININFPYISGAVLMFIGFLVSLVWVSEQFPQVNAQADPHTSVDSSALVK